MSDTPRESQPAAPALPSSSSLIFTLGGLAMISGVLIVLAYQLTLPRIAQNKREALERAVFTVLPGATVRSNFFVDASGLVALPPDAISQANVYAGYDDDGRMVGLAMRAAARGYQDMVRVLYGYSPERQAIIGFTVLESTETPGLGDRINSDPAFLANFERLDAGLNDDGTALKHPIVTVKHGKKTDPWQIDGISGATISSTAVGKALNESASALLPLLAKYMKESGAGFPPPPVGLRRAGRRQEDSTPNPSTQHRTLNTEH